MKISLKNISYSIGIFALCASLCGCHHAKSELEINLPDKFEGKNVEFITFADSTLVADGMVNDGKLKIELEENDSIRFPLFTQVIVDGRVRAFYIFEEGKASLADSMNVASGTPLNDEFAVLLNKLDSVEDIDDIQLYIDYAEELYNSHKESPYRDYFGIEWLKYANPERVDSFMNCAPTNFRGTKRARYYENFARLRAQTAPGNKYIDFTGEDANGRMQTLSSMIVPGKLTILDFWASWCPYCIKELPELQSLYNDYKEKGVEIIGIAVRDKPEDTKAMVDKKELPWKIMYNAQRTPYDIYGFSGIPHHILLDGNGVIISRGENVSQIKERLYNLLLDTSSGGNSPY